MAGAGGVALSTALAGGLWLPAGGREVVGAWAVTAGALATRVGNATGAGVIDAAGGLAGAVTVTVGGAMGAGIGAMATTCAGAGRFWATGIKFRFPETETWWGVRSFASLSFKLIAACAHCWISARDTAPEPSVSVALPRRQSRTPCVAKPPLPGSSKLTSSGREEVIWTTFSCKAPKRVVSPSRPRVLRFEG